MSTAVTNPPPVTPKPPRTAKCIVLQEGIEIPLGIENLNDFRAWARSDAFPDKGRIGLRRHTSLPAFRNTGWLTPAAAACLSSFSREVRTLFFPLNLTQTGIRPPRFSSDVTASLVSGARTVIGTTASMSKSSVEHGARC